VQDQVSKPDLSDYCGTHYTGHQIWGGEGLVFTGVLDSGAKMTYSRRNGRKKHWRVPRQ